MPTLMEITRDLYDICRIGFYGPPWTGTDFGQLSKCLDEALEYLC